MQYPFKYYKAIFGGVTVTGVGLCIGGIFVPPLLIPGGILLTGSMSMCVPVCIKMYEERSNRNLTTSAPTPPPSPVLIHHLGHARRDSDTASVVNIVQNNMFFVYTPSPPLSEFGTPTRPDTPALDAPIQTLVIS